MTNEPAMRLPTRQGVLRAAEKVAAILPATPLIPVEIRGQRVWCKAESLQPIGAFKIRGAWHRLTDLDDDERARGVVAVSSGNHAQGVAWAARRLKIAATIVVEKESQKGIVIGAGGQRLKQIGTDARLEIEQLLERKVFLELWVKVQEDWTDSAEQVRQLLSGDTGAAG